MIAKVISGGQTGVDRAALDAAMALGIPVGGYCPRGRRAEDGALSARYPLIETGSTNYRERTAKNIHVADATLVLFRGAMTPGTALTIKLAQFDAANLLVVDLDALVLESTVTSTCAWLLARRGPNNQAQITLNVAGPRESARPGIYAEAHARLTQVFKTTAAAGA